MYRTKIKSFNSKNEYALIIAPSNNFSNKNCFPKLYNHDIKYYLNNDNIFSNKTQILNYYHNFDITILFKSLYSYTHGKEDIQVILYAEYICVILIRNLLLIHPNKYIRKDFLIFE